MTHSILDEKRMQLEKEISNAIWEHRRNNPLIIFNQDLKIDKSNVQEVIDLLIENWEVEELPQIEMRNDTDGTLFDVYVLFIDENGINYITPNNNKLNQCGINDFSDMRDRLTLLEEIEKVI